MKIQKIAHTIAFTLCLILLGISSAFITEAIVEGERGALFIGPLAIIYNIAITCACYFSK